MLSVLATGSLDFASQSFEEFSRGLSGQSLMLYGGIGLVLWYVFGNKLGAVKSFVGDLVNKGKSLIDTKSVPANTAVLSIDDILGRPATKVENMGDSGVFFKLIVSWKQTRDLAVQAGCDEAIKIADDMFPHLSVNNCGKK